MPPAVCGILNDGIGGYGVAGAGIDYEGWEGVRHLLLVSISNLYSVALFGSIQSNV